MSIAIIFCVAILWWLVAEIRLYLTPKNALPGKIYRRLYKSSHRIGLPLQPGNTAFEFARQLTSYLVILSRDKRWSKWMLSNIAAIDHLTDIFVWQLFSLSESAGFDKIEFIKAYKKVRRLLWFLWLLTKLYRLKLLRPVLGINARRFLDAIQIDYLY